MVGGFLAVRVHHRGDRHRDQELQQHVARLGAHREAEEFALFPSAAAVDPRNLRTPFGQGCLLARRLVEAGLPAGRWFGLEQALALGLPVAAWSTMTAA